MISVKNIELRLGSKVLLKEASTVINQGEKVSIVGRNGAGKSTFFSLISGRIGGDAGEIGVPQKWRLAQVEQQMPESALSATEFVLAGDTELMSARASLKRALEMDDGMAIAQAYSDLADAGDHVAVPKAQALILGLGFRPLELDNPVSTFSGGWRMRLQLARALMCPSDLLLLDEPTNHLDLDALLWLESWLEGYAGTILVISHDREFLDAVTNVTLHLDQCQLWRYNGNYSAFERLRAERLQQQEVANAKQQEQIAHLQKYIDRFRYKATKARQAQSRIKALERFERIGAVIADADFTFSFKEASSHSNPLLVIEEASFGYIGADDSFPTFILKDVQRSIFSGQRIGLLGANGQGKTTFVKTIVRAIAPLAGLITEGRGLAIGYFAQQELDVLRVESTPLMHMTDLAKRRAVQSGEGSNEQSLRSFLGTFNITGELVTQRVGTLSGGEKARLLLCMIVWQRPNLLILDEPTNHLDLSTRDALALALNQFDGSVMLVSHDRSLLRTVCDEFWLVSRGQVVPFDGDLEDYQAFLASESKRMTAAEKGDRKDRGRAPEADVRTTHVKSHNPDRRAKSIQRNLDTIENRMEVLRSDRLKLEHLISTSRDLTQLASLGNQIYRIDGELEGLEDQWLELYF